MPLIQGKTSVGIGAVVDNVLTGSQFEFLPYNALVEFGLCGGANGADLRVDVYSGADVLLESAPMNAQARIPIFPDDFVLTDVAAGGERLKIRVRNLNAAAVDLYHAVRITPI